MYEPWSPGWSFGGRGVRTSERAAPVFGQHDIGHRRILCVPLELRDRRRTREQTAPLHRQQVFDFLVESGACGVVATGWPKRRLTASDSSQQRELCVGPLRFGTRRTAAFLGWHLVPRNFGLAIDHAEPVGPDAQSNHARSAKPHVVHFGAEVDRPVVVAKWRRAEARTIVPVRHAKRAGAISVLRQPSLRDLAGSRTAPPPVRHAHNEHPAHHDPNRRLRHAIMINAPSSTRKYPADVAGRSRNPRTAETVPARKGL